MVRWGQAPLSREMLGAATAVWRPDLYDAAIGEPAALLLGESADGIGAFAGPPFDAENIEAHLAAWTIKARGAELSAREFSADPEACRDRASRPCGRGSSRAAARVCGA